MFLLSEIVSSNYNNVNNPIEASPLVTTVMRKCTRVLHFQSWLSLCKMKGPWVCFAFRDYSWSVSSLRGPQLFVLTPARDCFQKTLSFQKLVFVANVVKVPLTGVSFGDGLFEWDPENILKCLTWASIHELSEICFYKYSSLKSTFLTALNSWVKCYCISQTKLQILLF